MVTSIFKIRQGRPPPPFPPSCAPEVECTGDDGKSLVVKILLIMIFLKAQCPRLHKYFFSSITELTFYRLFPQRNKILALRWRTYTMTTFQVFRIIFIYDYIKMIKQSNVDYSKKNSSKKKKHLRQNYIESWAKFSRTIETNDKNYKAKKICLLIKRQFDYLIYLIFDLLIYFLHVFFWTLKLCSNPV